MLECHEDKALLVPMARESAVGAEYKGMDDIAGLFEPHGNFRGEKSHRELYLAINALLLPALKLDGSGKFVSLQ